MSTGDTVEDFVTKLMHLQHQHDIALSTDIHRIQDACTDWRKRYRTQAVALCAPNTTAALQAVVALCNDYDVAITTQGGNTGLVGGAVPVADWPKPHVLLQTHRLHEVLHVDANNLTLTASAGYTLKAIQDAADEAGLWFPLSLASEGSCTLGGNLASNAGGTAVLRYGNARELCMGLEFVNAQGELCGDLKGLRKNNTGYDLRNLLIGSEGTLGIVTCAVMKVFPKPKGTVTAWCTVRSIADAVGLLSRLQSDFYTELTGFEWMNAESVRLVEQHFGLSAPGGSTPAEHVLVELHTQGEPEQLTQRLTSCLEAWLGESHSGLEEVYLAQNSSQRLAWWAIRESISEAQAKEGLNVKHDVACAVGHLPLFHDQALNALRDFNPAIRPVLFGHLGDGNLHFNISGPAGESSAAFLKESGDAISQIVHNCIMEQGGTFSAEHGIGQLKVDLLAQYTSAPHYKLMRAIKTALDPKGLLNPGKVIKPI